MVFLNHEAAVHEMARLDKAAFERDDKADLAAAFDTFKNNRDGCLLHMMQSMRPLGGVEWNLPKFAPFLAKYPTEEMVLDGWMRIQKGATPPDDSESVLCLEDQLMLQAKPWGSSEHRLRLRNVVDKILRDPKHCDVRRVLSAAVGEKDSDEASDMCVAYTPEVHVQFVALLKPLKALVSDVGNKERQALHPPVFAI